MSKYKEVIRAIRATFNLGIPLVYLLRSHVNEQQSTYGMLLNFYSEELAEIKDQVHLTLITISEYLLV